MRLRVALSVVFTLAPLFGLVAGNGKQVILIRRAPQLVPAPYHHPAPQTYFLRPLHTHPAPSHHHVRPAPLLYRHHQPQWQWPQLAPLGHHQHHGNCKGGGLEWGRGDKQKGGYDDKQLVKEKVVIKEEKVHNDKVQVVVKESPPKVIKERVKVIVVEARPKHKHQHDCGNKLLKKWHKSLKKSHKGHQHQPSYFQLHHHNHKGSKHAHQKSPVVFFHTQTPYYYFTQPPRRYYNNYYDGYNNDYGTY